MTFTAYDAGLYVHIPFCLQKCTYCDFYSIVDITKIDLFVNSLILEIEQWGPLKFNTIYFGGGTPSVLSIRAVSQILDKIYQVFKIGSDAEMTIEVNPGTVSKKYLSELKKLGFNRLNIGIQSFQEQNLKFLGRIHSAFQAKDSIENAHHVGFDNIGIDLIYGIPGQSLSMWKSDVKLSCSLAIHHLSAYALTYEPKTILSENLKAKKFSASAENEVCQMYNFLDSHLHELGFDHYEISNFAAHYQFRSQHNQKYWQFKPYLGLGPAAHSFQGQQRWWNSSSINQYIQSLEAGRSPIIKREKLTNDQQMMEMVSLSLRTKEGLDLEKFQARFGLQLEKEIRDLIRVCIKKGWLGKRPNAIYLTPAGMLLLDSIVAQILFYLNGCDL